MKKGKFIIAIIGIIFLGISWSGVEAADSLLEVLPVDQLYQISVLTPSGEDEYDYFVRFQVDETANQLKVITNGPQYRMESVYDDRLQLLTSEMTVISKEDAIRVGFDHRYAVYTPNTRKINITYYLDGVFQVNREIKLDQTAAEIEVTGLYLQALLLNGETNFHGRLIDLNSGGKMQLDSRLLTNKEIQKLAQEKRMAPQVKSILENSDDIYVFSIGYDGILRLFFPARFHVVLEKAAPHRILAFWGGSGDTMRYHYYQYQE